MAVRRAAYQGVLIPHPRLEVWASETTVDEDGAHVGQPVPSADNAGSMALRTRRRSRSADVGDVDVIVSAGGLAGPLGVGQAAQVLWRPTGETDWRGRDLPASPTGYEHLFWASATGNLTEYHIPSACRTAAGTVLVAVQREDNTGVSTSAVLVKRLAGGADAWSSTITAVDDIDDSVTVAPLLLALSDGRVLLYYTQPWVGDSDIVCVRLAYSDDDGVTWNVQPGRIEGLEGDLGYASVAEGSNGHVLFVTEDGTSITQLGSVDGGLSFTAVETLANASAPAVVADVDGFHVVYLDASGDVQHAALGSAFLPLSEVTPVDTGANGEHVAYCVDDAGRHWVHSYEWAANKTYHQVSYDRGETWDGLPQAVTGIPRGWFAQDDGLTAGTVGVFPRVYRTVAADGRVLVVTQWATTGDTDESVGVIYLGGYTTRHAAVSINEHGKIEAVPYRSTWYPWDKPTQFSWTRTAVNSAVDNLTSVGLKVSTAVGPGSVTWAWNDTIEDPDDTDGVTGRFRFRTSSTVSGANDEDQVGTFSFTRHNTSAETYGFRITIDATTIWVFSRDGTSTFTELASATIDASVGVDVFWCFDDDEVLVFYREVSDTGEDRAWTELVDVTVSDISGTVTTAELVWGCNVDVGVDGTWTEFQLSMGTSGNGPNGARGIMRLARQTELDRWVGTDLTAGGAELPDRVVLTATGGPAFPGDTWTIGTDADFAVEHLVEVASPRVGWRGGVGATVEYLAFTWADDPEWFGSDVIGIALYGSTLTAFDVEFHNGSGWTDARSVDVSISGLDWLRSTRTVQPNGSSDEVLVRLAEFNGSAFSEGSAAGRNAARITHTYEGAWTTTQQRATLQIDGDHDMTGWGTSGAAGVVIPRDVCVLIPLNGEVYKGVRIKLDSSSSYVRPPDNKWAIGSARIGPVLFHADVQDWGRTIESDAAVTLSSARDRTRRSRVNGPTRRTFTGGWTGGVTTWGCSLDDDTPTTHQFNGGGSGGLVASRGMTPWQMEGLVAELNGAASTFVYLPRIPTVNDDDAVVVLNRRHQHALVRLVTPIRLDVVEGDEGVDETFRIATYTMEEEV